MDAYYDYFVRNREYIEQEQPETPACVCPEHEGKAPVFCEACNQWTDAVVLTAPVPYSSAEAKTERAAENAALLAAFNRLMAEGRKAMSK